MRREIEQYLKQIESNLYTCPRKKRSAFLRDFRGNIDAYIEEHPNATLPELKSIFGSPEAIAESFLQSDEFATTKEVVSSKKWIIRTLLAAACILVVGTLILGTIFVVDNYRYTHGYIVVEEIQEGFVSPDPNAINID